MIVHKSTCGLCKPTKKYKRNRTKIKISIIHALDEGELSVSQIKSYFKKFAYK